MCVRVQSLARSLGCGLGRILARVRGLEISWKLRTAILARTPRSIIYPISAIAILARIAISARGVITCNYDGVAKHKTVVGAGAFVGSNSALVAPVEIGAGAVVGSGSVITRDVLPDALAITRAEQVEKVGTGARLMANKNNKAANKNNKAANKNNNKNNKKD